eukprot:scaffold93044_cov62-Phaeocystis_antarctica.AAC.4
MPLTLRDQTTLWHMQCARWERWCAAGGPSLIWRRRVSSGNLEVGPSDLRSARLKQRQRDARISADAFEGAMPWGIAPARRA